MNIFSCIILSSLKYLTFLGWTMVHLDRRLYISDVIVYL